MILISKTYWGGAPFNFRRKPRDAQVESLVLRTEDFRELHALYWTPAATPRPRIAVVCMHPRVDFTHHYSFPRLLDAGIGCLGANTRNPNNDVATVHEEIVLDVAACINFLRSRREVEVIILLGNSGGGSLSALYQAQANLPAGERIAVTPGGVSTRLPRATMPPADAMIYIAAHRGQGQVLAECIDPSVLDEHDPCATDPDLDMYNPANGFREPPAWTGYDDEFVARYRAAQLDRVARLDRRARHLIALANEAGAETERPEFNALSAYEQRRIQARSELESVMVVYRTMANLHYVDNHLDPSERDYGSLLSERPDLMNMKLLGFGRICTPHAWLSTWSGLSSNADLVRNLAGIGQPTLVAQAGRDREIYPRTDAEPIFAAVAASDKTCVTIAGARHYFEPDFGQKDSPHTEELMDAIIPWIQERFC